jgi:hypothetical protein
VPLAKHYNIDLSKDFSYGKQSLDGLLFPQRAFFIFLPTCFSPPPPRLFTHPTISHFSTLFLPHFSIFATRFQRHPLVTCETQPAR